MAVSKSKRSFRCSDILYETIERAAAETGMSTNEWISQACVRQINDPIIGAKLDVDDIIEAKKNERTLELIDTIQKTSNLFEKHLKELSDLRPDTPDAPE